ncbi:hypothetical protein BIU97_10275 [Curtobacterium sp. MCBA15_009]|uniref:helix-turn-helix domain-containing protein n=1 Tax=Curtobacterium sp. MCBA15_009 TaxID=1898737 RepID=UPI0008DDF9B8|nr:helix-turn-helix domain-containing protein [Curtobacterium sp. MCBA15_009]OII10505.1 hypothetical protein BIU97_10275 [Curtobacterium sp. MCBA15_009]
MKNAPAGTGSHLKVLRESLRVPQPLVAAMAGTSTAYLAKVEDGVLSPARSYVRKVTESIMQLAQDPPRPCPVLGCDNSKHINGMDGHGGIADLHHANEKRGEGWIVSVERFDGQDLEWSVYAEVSDDMALAAVDFLAFTAAYEEAAAYAAVLNRRGVVI